MNWNPSKIKNEVLNVIFAITTLMPVFASVAMFISWDYSGDTLRMFFLPVIVYPIIMVLDHYISE